MKTEKTVFILASKSPRRKTILKNLGINFKIYPSNIKEFLDGRLEPDKLVVQLSRQKARDVAIQFPDKIVIGADTLVVLDGKILGKPTDKNNAAEMLMELSDQTHTVITGVTLIQLSQEAEMSFFERTEVTFFKLSKEQIDSYVESNPPLDKAGGYGIQDWEAHFVKSFSGCHDNVVGFPTNKFKEVLSEPRFKETFDVDNWFGKEWESA